jgi:hypothetical protein
MVIIARERCVRTEAGSGMQAGGQCGICEAGAGRGEFQGEHTPDTEGDEGDADAWVWVFQLGEIVFVAGPPGADGNLFDAHTAMHYCDDCAREFREDHGIASATPLAAYEA